MTPFYTVLLLCFATALGALMVIGVVRRALPLSTPLIAMAIGLVAGPHALGLSDLSAMVNDPHRLLEEASRITLAMAVMATALRLPGFSWPLARAAGLTIIVLMPMMFLAGSALSWLFFGLSVPVALVLGAVLSPTDPVLASAVVTGKLARANVPAHLRHLLSAEAAANDGLALPFVMAPVLWLTMTPAMTTTMTPGEALGGVALEWLIQVLLWEVIIGAAFGWLAGAVVGRLMNYADRSGMMTNISVLSVSVALALSVLAAARVMQADGILSVFVAGLAFSRVILAREAMQAERMQDSARLLMEIPIFVLFGLAAPVGEWAALGLPAVWFAIALLFLRRLPFVLLIAGPTGFFRNWREQVYIGWFGPIGIAAIFYALNADRTAGLDLWPIVSLVVAVFILMHGIVATPVTHWMDDTGASKTDRPTG